MLKSIIKFFISIFANIIRLNKRSVEYLFTRVLKDEVAEYYENSYYGGVIHITNTITAAAKYIKPEHVILDLGGFIGSTAKEFAESFPQNQVYVFEPLPDNIKKIEKISAEYKNITIVPKAVGNISSKVFINKSANISSSSIFPLNADPNSPIFSGNLQVTEQLEIETIALDDFLPANTHVGIMKLDVQGYELNALKGALRTLKNTDFIVVEVVNHDYYKGGAKYYEIDQYLRENNFVISDIYPSLKDNKILKEWDCIYISKKIYDNWNN
jgi:FkbM family methyltransferase